MSQPSLSLNRRALVGVALLLVAVLSQTSEVFKTSEVSVSGAVVLAAPNAFSGPVNGGCYLDTPVACRLHIDNWQPIQTDLGQKLVGFRLVALRQDANDAGLLYEFRTDVSNPPGGSYLPSLVRLDYAAECGVTYRLSLLVQDSGDLDFETVGQTNDFACPAAATPTPSPTSTATATPTATPTGMPTGMPTGTPPPTATSGPPAFAPVYLPAVVGE